MTYNKVTQELTAAKAVVATVGTTITTTLTALVSSLPENDSVQLWGALAIGAVGAVTTAFATWKIPNLPK